MALKFILLFCLMITFLIIIEASGQTNYRTRATTVRPPNPTPSIIAPNQKCVDNSSPAENCFDYFTLAVSWTPGYAFYLHLDANSRRKDAKPEWLIHGLWPSMNDGGPTQNCDRTDVEFNEQGLSNKLRRELKLKWHSIRPRSDITFWKNEFDRHGNCATRSNAIKSNVTYFTKTIELFDKLDIFNTLSRNSYKPGNVKHMKDIALIVKSKHGKEVRVKPVVNKETPIPQHYLYEVFICYDTMLQAIDCPDKEIMYLDKFIS